MFKGNSVVVGESVRDPRGARAPLSGPDPVFKVRYTCVLNARRATTSSCSHLSAPSDKHKRFPRESLGEINSIVSNIQLGRAR